MGEEKSPAQWALDYYDKVPEVKETPAHNHAIVFTSSLTFALAPVLRNIWYRRPYYAGIQQHIIGAVLGGIIGYGIAKLTDNVDSVRDAVHRHYIATYPERFPEPTRVKFADVLYEWRPIR